MLCTFDHTRYPELFYTITWERVDCPPRDSTPAYTLSNTPNIPSSNSTFRLSAHHLSTPPYNPPTITAATPTLYTTLITPPYTTSPPTHPSMRRSWKRSWSRSMARIHENTTRWLPAHTSSSPPSPRSLFPPTSSPLFPLLLVVLTFRNIHPFTRNIYPFPMLPAICIIHLSPPPLLHFLYHYRRNVGYVILICFDHLTRVRSSCPGNEAPWTTTTSNWLGAVRFEWARSG